MTKTALQGGSEQQLVPGEERRRSQRVMIRVPVTLEYTVAGKKITLQASTASVNDHGAMLLCSRPLTTETKMEIQNDRTQGKLTCRITRTPVESPDGYLTPVEFHTPAPGFWRITFPPTNWKAVED